MTEDQRKALYDAARRLSERVETEDPADRAEAVRRAIVDMVVTQMEQAHAL